MSEAAANDYAGFGPLDVAFASWRLFFASLGALTKLYVITLILFVVVAIAFYAAQSTLLADYPVDLRKGNPIGFALYQWLHSVVDAMIGAPLGVAVIRYALRDESKSEYAYSPRVLRYVRWAIAYAIASLVMDAPGLANNMAVTLLLFILSLFLFFAFVRASLVYPAVALDVEDAWDHSWKLTQGHFWWILFAFFLPVFPLIVLGVGVVFIGGSIPPYFSALVLHPLVAIGAGLGASLVGCIYAVLEARYARASEPEIGPV